MGDVLVVIQARTGSRRLPGKVLLDVGGQPALALQLHRLRTLPHRVVVATTTDAADDAVAALAAAHGATVVRGPEHDVLARFALVLDEIGGEEIVRLTADCPFTDPALVEAVLARKRATGADYASNTVIRTHPDGLDVEVISATALREVAAQATEPYEREHVTPFVYRHPERYALAALLADESLGHERWTLDTADDLAILRDLAQRVGPDATWTEVLEAAGRTPLPDGARPALPIDDPHAAPWDDPGDRPFVVQAEGRLVGRGRVRVRAGIAEVVHASGEQVESAARAWLRDQPQVRVVAG